MEFYLVVTISLLLLPLEVFVKKEKLVFGLQICEAGIQLLY